MAIRRQTCVAKAGENVNASSVTIELEPSLLAKLDGLVEGHLFHSRSDAVAAREEIERMALRHQFLTEFQKLDPADEQATAEEWLNGIQTNLTAS